ncbi:MAG: carbohydrate-binding domain-containing protein [Sphaerochaetaceae bacterium]|nr:carbohydrate-binding domain-containing protein [Sphaerochaetaceae bacterium]
MKRTLITSVLILVLVCTAFAQGVSEVTPTIVYDASVDLTTGESSSDSVSATFNKDGNLEVTYKGTSPISIGLTGSLDGTLIVKSDDSDYTLVLNNVTIKASTLPAMQLKSTTTATILLAEGSSNYVSDSADNSKKGAITSSGNIIIDGLGNLTLEVYKKHGIKTDGALIINGGNTYIHGDEAAEGNMVSADLYFTMNDGYLCINAEGNVHATESKGIKVNGVEGVGTGLGYVEINGGTLDITSVGKAITAGWKIDEDATTETTEDNPIPNVYINGGDINIKTTGIPYEYSEEESLSPEGIEAKDTLYINGGTIHAYTSDDTLNAGKAIVINGGYVFAIATDNDSIDSNGTIAINGGTVITMSSSREQAFDCDNDTRFTYTGGTIVGAGNGNNMPKSADTTAHSIAYGNKTFYAGDQIAVLDSEGNVITGFVVPYEVPSLTSIVFGSEDFVEGQSYTIALGAFEVLPSDGLVPAGTSFVLREEVVTMDMNDIAVSEGYIGMNIGGAGNFGGGAMGFGGKGMNGAMDMGARGMNNRNMGNANVATRTSTNTSLPAGVTLPENLDASTALELVRYLVENYVDPSMLFTLFGDGAMQMMQSDFNPSQMPMDMPMGGFDRQQNGFSGQMPPAFN